MIHLPTFGKEVRILPFADGDHGADRRQPFCQLVETHDELAARCLQGVGDAVARVNGRARCEERLRVGRNEADAPHHVVDALRIGFADSLLHVLGNGK